MVLHVDFFLEVKSDFRYNSMEERKTLFPSHNINLRTEAAPSFVCRLCSEIKEQKMLVETLFNNNFYT